MPSLFDAMYTVNFDEKDRIYGMNSDNGETIDLDKIVTCIGGVEVSNFHRVCCFQELKTVDSIKIYDALYHASMYLQRPIMIISS